MAEWFEAWNKVYAPPVHAGIDKPLAPGSVFLFESVMLPHFQVSPSGWDWFDSPRDLAGYLLHVGLPDLAGWWFDQTTTFGGPPKRLPLGETVAWAAEATDVDPEDQAFFLALAEALKSLLAGTAPVRFEDVAKVVERFSARFNKDGHWMILETYPDAVAAGTAVFDRHDEVASPATGEELTRSEWLELCKRAGADAATGQVVRAVFADDHSV